MAKCRDYLHPLSIGIKGGVASAWAFLWLPGLWGKLATVIDAPLQARAELQLTALPEARARRAATGAGGTLVAAFYERRCP